MYIVISSLSCLNPFRDFPGTHSILQCLPGPVWHDQVLCDMACAHPPDFIAYPSSTAGFSSPESLALFSFLKHVTPSPASGLCIFSNSRTVSSDYYGSAAFLSSFRSQLKHFLLWEFLDHLIYSHPIPPQHSIKLSNFVSLRALNTIWCYLVYLFEELMKHFPSEDKQGICSPQEPWHPVKCIAPKRPAVSTSWMDKWINLIFQGPVYVWPCDPLLETSSASHTHSSIALLTSLPSEEWSVQLLCLLYLNIAS